MGVDDTRGMDALMLTLAMAQAWNTTSPSVRSMNEPAELRLRQHRASLMTGVAAVIDALQ